MRSIGIPLNRIAHLPSKQEGETSCWVAGVCLGFAIHGVHVTQGEMARAIHQAAPEELGPSGIGDRGMSLALAFPLSLPGAVVSCNVGLDEGPPRERTLIKGLGLGLPFVIRRPSGPQSWHANLIHGVDLDEEGEILNVRLIDPSPRSPGLSLPGGGKARIEAWEQLSPCVALHWALGLPRFRFATAG